MFREDLRLPDKFDWWNFRAILDEWAYKLVNDIDYSDAEVIATGALIARSLENRFADVVNVKDHGVVADNATDDTSAWQTLINTANTAYIATGRATTLFFPRGVSLSGQLTWKSGVHLLGDGIGSSILKLKNSSNATLILGENAVSLFSGATSGGLADYGFCNLTLDGNRANNASGHILQIYGRSPLMFRVYFRQAPERALYHKWGVASAVTDRGVEGVFSQIYIEICGKECLYFEGPNDSHFSDVFCVSGSQSANNTYDNIVITGPYANMTGTRIHSWRWSPGGFGMNYPRYAMRVETNGCVFSQIEIEGGYTASLYHDAQFCAYDAACQFYAVRTGGCTIVLRDSYNILQGTMLGPESGTCYGLQMGQSGDTVIQNDIQLMAIEQQLGVVDWTYDGGQNRVRMRGLNSAGTVKVGAATSTDVVGVIAGGGGGSI